MIRKRTVFSNKQYSLWVVLYQAVDTIRILREKELKKIGLTIPQVAVLIGVDLIGERATPSAIARQVGRQQHSTSRLVVRMEKRGLVNRSHDKENKNRINIKLTKKGSEKLMIAVKSDVISRLIYELSVNEQKQLNSHLMKLVDAAITEFNASYPVIIKEAAKSVS